MTPKEALLSAPTASTPQPEHSTPTANTVAITLTQFDRRHYVKLIKARGETISRVVAELKPVLDLSTALDAGYSHAMIIY
jgi:hypothetical protein